MTPLYSKFVIERSHAVTNRPFYLKELYYRDLSSPIGVKLFGRFESEVEADEARSTRTPEFPPPPNFRALMPNGGYRHD
jgi:hypothetical protein